MTAKPEFRSLRSILTARFVSTLVMLSSATLLATGAILWRQAEAQWRRQGQETAERASRLALAIDDPGRFEELLQRLEPDLLDVTWLDARGQPVLNHSSMTVQEKTPSAPPPGSGLERPAEGGAGSADSAQGPASGLFRVDLLFGQGSLTVRVARPAVFRSLGVFFLAAFIFQMTAAMLTAWAWARWVRRRMAEPLEAWSLRLAKIDGSEAASQIDADWRPWLELAPFAGAALEWAQDVATLRDEQTRLLRLAEHQMKDRERQFSRALRASEEESFTDPLTGLRNRRFLDTHGAAIMERGRAASLPVSLALIDLDRFKQLNDEHGHEVGDSILLAAAKLMGGIATDKDHVIRLGGDEFVLLFTETSLAEAVQRTQRLVHMFRQLAAAHLTSAGITMSAGVASSESRFGIELKVLLREADQQLYQAKSTGKNRVCSASSVCNQKP